MTMLLMLPGLLGDIGNVAIGEESIGETLPTFSGFVALMTASMIWLVAGSLVRAILRKASRYPSSKPFPLNSARA